MLDLDVDTRGVATVTIARPEKHNALSAPLMEQMTAMMAKIADDQTIRVVILTGQGASFCAGGDLRWMEAQMAGDVPQRKAAARKLAGMLQAINTLPKPVIGRVQGNAFGGGVGLACVCDVVVAADHAKFGLTETRLGLTPATIGPYVVARMGEAMARRVFMSSRLFGADEAARLGIVARSVPADELDAAVGAEVDPYLSCAPGAVAAAKALARALGPEINESVIELTVDALVAQWDGKEAKEGISAFFERRSPNWAATLAP